MTSVHERTAQFLNPTRRRWRDIVTPEGVTLRVELAEPGERAAAFFLDVLICTLTAFLIELLVVLALRYDREDIVVPSVALLVAFLIRNFYFIHFELAWQGVTPGKRLIGIRVIDRGGGMLQPAAVIARNLTRELECFMPLSAGVLVGGAAAWAAWGQLALALWVVLIGLLPLFNRDRLRGGDIIAGTMVIAQPKRRLLADLGALPASLVFTERQLRAYGAFELQILEELLRRPEGRETAQLRRDVCDKICKKIDWPQPVRFPDVVPFLTQFYAAQRAFLEREQLYGRRRDDKDSPVKPAA